MGLTLEIWVHFVALPVLVLSVAFLVSGIGDW